MRGLDGKGGSGGALQLMCCKSGCNLTLRVRGGWGLGWEGRGVLGVGRGCSLPGSTCMCPEPSGRQRLAPGLGEEGGGTGGAAYQP